MWVCPYLEMKLMCARWPGCSYVHVYVHMCMLMFICACLCSYVHAYAQPYCLERKPHVLWFVGVASFILFQEAAFSSLPYLIFEMLMKSRSSIQAGISAETPTWKPWAYAHWHPWSTMCEFQGDIIMAEVKQWDDSDVCCFCVRCYSALGNIAKARYLKETVTIAEEVERQVVSVGRRKKSSFYIWACDKRSWSKVGHTAWKSNSQ